MEAISIKRCLPMSDNTFIKTVTRKLFGGLLCFLPVLVWFWPVIPQAVACEQVTTLSQVPTLTIADNPIQRGLNNLKIESAGDKAQGATDEAVGKTQRAVGKVTGQTEGAIREAKGEAKQAAGDAKGNASKAGDKAENASKSLIDKVKDFFD
jgi:uncharacterized protein YjbJ (UPF0337 family)